LAGAMTSTARSGVAVLLATLGFLLVMAALLLMRQPRNAAAILLTGEPTVVSISSLTPEISPPTLLSTLDVQSAPNLFLSAPPLMIPAPLVDPALPLLVGPVDVPLELHIPALNIASPVLAVGLTLTNAMASPVGMLPEDPIWQSVFWYRGGTIPGHVGTATFAGHFDDDLGRPAVFAYLSELEMGELIIVRDTRSDLDIAFVVTETITYTNEQSTDPAVLARVFGSSSVNNEELQPDQLSRLTLITCGGEWDEGSFDLRLVVYAVRVD